MFKHLSLPVFLLNGARRTLVSALPGTVRVQNNRDTFMVTMDVQKFKPENIKYGIVGSHLVVEGNHESPGSVHLSFNKRFKLPDNAVHNSFTSTLTSDGVLTLKVTKEVLNENYWEIPFDDDSVN